MNGEGLVVYRARGGIDAIDEYSRRLAQALPARYVPSGLGGLRAADAPWVLLQYNPFRFGRAGFAPRLLAQVRALRVPLAVMVHEAWIDIEDARSAFIGGWQRFQLRALLPAATVVLTSTQAIADELRGGAVHVPVASTLTPVPSTREAARERLGLGRDDQIVVALFGRGNPSRALDHARAAVDALVHALPVTVLNLGADAPPMPAPVRNTGPLDPATLSLHLHATDLLLLPFEDGLSSRRTTLMAGLAHAVPVLGLRGRNTEPLLDAGVVMTPVGDHRAYVRAALSLAADPERRAVLAADGHALYRARFDWPVLAATVRAELMKL